MLQTFIVALFATGFLYIVPGLALLDLLWTRRDLDWADRLGLAAGLSVAVYPILFLLAYLIGIAPGPVAAWMPGGVGLIVLAAGWVRRRRAGERWAWSSEDLPPLLLIGVIGVLLGVRLWSAREMVAPAWGDSVHHTFIVQLILDHGGLFQSWQPYAPIATMTYHFGFHTNAAVWAWLTGLDAPTSVIQAGQVFNVLAVLVLYPLGKRLGGSAWAGLAGVVVAGLLFPFPGFYVNWGRYTQLTGQIVLLPALWFVDVWWREKERPAWPSLILVVILLLGTGLSHYRVLVILAAGAVAWTLWAAWLWRRNEREAGVRLGQLLLAGGVAGLLFLPWVQVIRQGALSRVASSIVAASTDGGSPIGEIVIWTQTHGYFSDYFWMAAVVALILALIWRRELAVPVGLWAGLSFLAANPHLLGLIGTGLLSNFLLVIALYIPIGLLLGWLIAALLTRLPDPRWRDGAGVLLVGIGLFLGIPTQARIVDPFFQMVTPQDLAVMDWIKTNTPTDSRFLVNGFLVYGGSAAAGSDAGWWLPLYTQRTSTLPPIMYLSEAQDPSFERDMPRRVVAEMLATAGEPTALDAVLCREGITHLFIGQRRGTVAGEPGELLPEAWLVDNPTLTLAKATGLAEVWSFDRTGCGGR